MVSENRAASWIVRSTYDEDAVRAAAEACREQIGGRPTVVFAFISSDWRPHFADFVEVVQVYGHAAQVVGCSTDGFIGTNSEDENVSGCCLIFLHFPETDLSFLELEADDMEDFEAGNIEHGGFWISLINPFLAHAEHWMNRWNAVFDQAPTFGGLASGGGDPEDVFLFHNRNLGRLACIGIRFHGGVRVRGVVSQGCRPIGNPYTITEVQDNRVISIAARRAFDVLTEAFESLSEEDQLTARGNLFAGLAVNEYLDEMERGDFLVRNILSGDPVDGFIALGAFPRSGQTLQFQFRDKDAADEELRILCRSVQETHGPPIAGLLFCCAGRGAQMFGVPNHDAGVIAEIFGQLPLGGFFCNGEVGPISGTNFLHGYTASAALFYDADA